MLHKVGELEFSTKACIKVPSSCLGMVWNAVAERTHFTWAPPSWLMALTFFLRFVLFFRMDSSWRLSEMIRIKTESCRVLWNVKIVMNVEKYLFNCWEYYKLNSQDLKMMYPTDHFRILYTLWIWDKRTYLMDLHVYFICVWEKEEREIPTRWKAFGEVLPPLQWWGKVNVYNRV